MVDSPVCSECQQVPSAFSCCCVVPPASLCHSCLSPHASAPGFHVLNQQQQSVRLPDCHFQKCDICAARAALRFCICENTVKALCDVCEPPHVLTGRPESHAVFPILAYNCAKQNQSAAFVSRQKYVDSLWAEIARNLTQFDHCTQMVEKRYDDVIIACQRNKAAHLSELQTLRQQLVQRLMEAYSEIESLRYCSNYEVKTWLQFVVLHGYLWGLAGPKLVDMRMEDGHEGKLVADSIHLELDLDLLATPVADLLPVLEHNSLSLYNVTDFSKRDSLRELHVGEDSVLCFVNPAFLFCCGSLLHSKAYHIDVMARSVTNLHEMTYIRSRPGLWNPITDPILYIFGGFGKGKCLRTAEIYNIDSDRWTLTRCEMTVAKTACSVCSYQSDVFVSGVSETHRTIELFNRKAEEFTLLISSLGSTWDLLFTFEAGLYWVHSDSIDIIPLSKKSREVKVGASVKIPQVGDGNYWQAFQPAVRGMVFVGAMWGDHTDKMFYKFTPARYQFARVIAPDKDGVSQLRKPLLAL